MQSAIGVTWFTLVRGMSECHIQSWRGLGMARGALMPKSPLRWMWLVSSPRLIPIRFRCPLEPSVLRSSVGLFRDATSKFTAAEFVKEQAPPCSSCTH